MAWQFSNFPVAVLAAAISDSDGTITIAAGHTYPASGEFVIRIDSELIKIASRSGNVLTVASGGRGYGGTTAADHNALAIVLIELAAEVLQSFAQSDGRTEEIRFDYGDATPKTLFTVPANKLIQRVAIVIFTAFDGASPALTVGDAGDTDRLMTASQVDPSAAGTYEVSPGYKYGSDTAVTLSITPGSGATAGSGLVVIDYES